MAVSLLDAVVSLRLASAGLPQQTAIDQENPTPPQADPVYNAQPQKTATLSGYGQLLSAASRFSDALATGTSGTVAASSNTAVATATTGSSATPGIYNLSVTKAAKGEELTSTAYAADPAAVQYGIGAFTIQQSSAASPTTVNVTTGSLNGIRDAINTANAGVTASVAQNSFGYYLSIKSNQTGLGADTFSIASSNDPLTSFRSSLAVLGLNQTQAPDDAAYSINGAAATSSSNSVSFASGATLTLAASGTTSVTVGQSLASLTSSAQSFVNNYNALLGSIKSLTGTGASLNGDATANGLKTSLFSTLTSTLGSNNGSSLLALSQIGISAADSSSPLTFNVSTLTTAYNANATDSLGASSLLSTIGSSLKALTDSYTGASGTINTQASAVVASVKSDINATIAGYSPTATVPDAISNILTQRALAVNGNISLPGFSTYA